MTAVASGPSRESQPEWDRGLCVRWVAARTRGRTQAAVRRIDVSATPSVFALSRPLAAGRGVAPADVPRALQDRGEARRAEGPARLTAGPVYWGLAKVNLQAVVTATVTNLKRLAKLLARGPLLVPQAG